MYYYLTIIRTYIRRPGTAGGDDMSNVAGVINGMLVGEVLDPPDVARVTKATDRSVLRWMEGAPPRRATEERLLELRSVVDLLRRVMRDEPARLWLRSPEPDLGYEKPLDLIERGEYRRVVGVLLALAEGVTA